MATFGQMLAASQAFAAPAQQRKQAQSESMAAEFEVEKEKKSQMEELQALMEAEMKKASEKKGPFGALGDIGKLLSFIPAIGTGVGTAFQTLAATGQAGAQKKALKNLMKSSKFDKYKGTWLGDPTKQYLKDVKGLAGDIDPLKTGLTSLATSMITGKIAKGIGGKFKDAFSPGVSEQIAGQPGGVGIKADLLGGDMVGADRFTSSLTGESLADSRGFGIKADLLGGGSKFNPLAKQFDVLGGEKIAKQGIGSGALKELFGDFDLMDIIGKAGGEKGIKNLQALPLLMQMFGGGGGNVEFDPQSYFN